MLRAQIPELGTILVAQSYPELDTLAHAVGNGTDLAQTLRTYIDLVRHVGLKPDSVHFIGDVAMSMLAGLERLSDGRSIHAAHAAILLEEIGDEVLVGPAETMVWPPGEDIVAHIQALPNGPHSAEVMVQTGGFEPAQEWLGESRRVPLTVGTFSS